MATNDYFDSADYTAIPKHTTGRSAAINGFMAAIENGFTRLPAEARIKEGRVTWGTFGGTANAHTVTLPYTVAYGAGLRVGYLPTLANTGALTVNVNALGVVAVKRPDGADLAADDIAVAPMEIVHNGTNFTLTLPSSAVAAAAASASAAAAIYDSFDDRYLGSKTSNPTLDNDGNALLTGALYWNSTVGEMRVYNGAAWQQLPGSYLMTYPVYAGSMTPRTTNGAAAGLTELAANKNMVRTLDFDTTTQEFAQFDIVMPKGWDEGTISFQPIWTAGSGSGTVVWALQAVATGDGDDMDVAFGTEQTSTDTFVAANKRHIAPTSSAITIAGTPAEGDVVQCQIKRVPASDTLAVDARLISARIFLTINSISDV